MNAFPIALLVLACGLALAQPAAAQADFLTAPKVACTPESVTRCTAPGTCTTRPASARDKTEILAIDFAGKKATVRRGGDTKPLGDVVEEQVSGDVRRFVIAESGGTGPGSRLASTLSKAGKLALLIGNDGSKAEATCVAES